MTAPRRIRRRTFLLGAAGAGVSALWGSARLWPFAQTPVSAGERLAGLIDHESARVIGREYLRLVPGEASAATLAARVVERLPGGSRAVDAASDDRLHELLLGVTLEDFEGLRTVELHGWVLARTEARLCALAALREGAVSA
ncbi:MAG: hypothetical protein ACRDOG_11685 [Gaiellaceae bacterium]